MTWCTEDEVPDELCSNLQKIRLRFVDSYNLKVQGDLWLQVRLDSVLRNMNRSQFVFSLSSSWFCCLCVSSIFRQVSLGTQKGHPGYILHPTQWESIPVASQKKHFSLREAAGDRLISFCPSLGLSMEAISFKPDV